MTRLASGSDTDPALVVGVGLTVELLLNDVPPLTRIVLAAALDDPFMVNADELFELTKLDAPNIECVMVEIASESPLMLWIALTIVSPSRSGTRSASALSPMASAAQVMRTCDLRGQWATARAEADV